MRARLLNTCKEFYGRELSSFAACACSLVIAEIAIYWTQTVCWHRLMSINIMLLPDFHRVIQVAKLTEACAKVCAMVCDRAGICQ